MATIVSLLNMKGGVGKTTLTYNLAWYAAYEKNLRVLVVDLDPQSNLSQYFFGDDKYEAFLAEGSTSIVDIFENANKELLPIYVIEEWSDDSLIHLIPSKIELSTTLKNPTTKERRLARFLSRIEEAYDLILIDCPPTDSILSVASYIASEYVLIPVRPERLATIGLPLLARSMREFNEENKGEYEIKVAGVVFNDVEQQEAPEHRKAKKHVVDFARQNKWPLFTNEVRHSRSFPTGSRMGTPIFQTPYVKDYVTKEFFKVGKEFLRSVGLG